MQEPPRRVSVVSFTMKLPSSVVRWLLPLTCVLTLGLVAGCASTGSQSKSHDVTLLQPGMTRGEVLQEFGRPANATRSKAGLPVDIFTFVQKAEPAKRKPQPIEPGEEDNQMLKIMLNQSGFSPERMLEGQRLTVQVNYDANEVVKDSFLLEMDRK